MRDRSRMRLVRGPNVEHIFPTFVSYAIGMPDGTTVQGDAVLPLRCAISEPAHVAAIHAIIASGVKASDQQTGAAIVGGPQPRVVVLWWKALKPIVVKVEPQPAAEPA